MDILKTRKNLENNLLVHLQMVSPRSSFKNVYSYALIPSGKLFRPLLVMAILEDFGKLLSNNLACNNDHSLLASALEIHHTYTLIHDDLPAMDNDDYRRGRPSTHKQFGQWQAILAGDGLINSSYHLLSKMKSNNTLMVNRIVSHLLGPKGLIEGQVIDLSGKAQESFNSLKKMHELKTSRLIQAAIVSSYLLLETNHNYRTTLDLFKLGKYMGLIFQFLDDLCELTETFLSTHEQSINPWLHHLEQSNQHLTSSLDKLTLITKKYHMNSFNNVLREYLDKISYNLSSDKDNIEDHIKNQTVLNPIMTRLNSICNT